MTTTTSSADGGGGAASPPPPTSGEPAAQPLQHHRPTLLMDVAIRCTAISCSCDCFTPCKAQIRICDGCGHGWVSHALDKLGFRHLFNCHQVEVVQPSIAFDVASLMLYGTQAIPVRLKILLDRLFSVLQQDEVLQVLHGFGWTYEDYARGYIVQDPSGVVLDKWLLASREEEPLILQQFLRFGETKTIAQQLLLQEGSERSEFVTQSPKTESDIKKFIEKTSRSVVGGSSLFKQRSNNIYNHMGCQIPAMSSQGNNKSFRQPTSSVSSNQSASPPISSPVNCTSPTTLSPLNRLQNMQPYDFRREKNSPDLPKNENSERSVVPFSVNCLTSPTTSVPNISFATSSLSNLTNNTSTYTTASSDRSGNEDGVYCSDADDVDETDAAINLTRSSLTSSFLDSVYAAKKVRHLRKSANPMKRRWNPTVLAQLSTNPSTGKKRVQCHVCLKTFCDKGALKIHFSAVHLREMHKCTVEGCNMMFSSRRSRNRHSANPNPKLHTPNFRRKINPHDGRAANPYPLMPPSSILDFNNGIVNYSSGPHDDDSSSGSEIEHRTTAPKLKPVYDIKVEESQLSEMRERNCNIEDDLPLPLTKKCRLDEDASNNHANEGMDLSMRDVRKSSQTDVNGIADFHVSCNKERSHLTERKLERKGNEESTDYEKIKMIEKDRNPTRLEKSDSKLHSFERDRLMSSEKGVRKRKNMNPIKCTTASDEDLQFVSSGDSSSDTYIDPDNEESGLLDSKSDCSSEVSDSMNDLDDMDDNNSNSDKEKRKTVKTESFTPSEVVNFTQMSTTKEAIEKCYQEYEKFNGSATPKIEKCKESPSSIRSKESEDISENPLRHLESLSLGAFTNMMNVPNRTNFNSRTNNLTSGVSYHAPGLGLASVTTTTAPNRVDSPATDMLPLVNSSHQSPSIPGGCTLNNNSDTENSMSEQQLNMVPVYRDASMVGSVEIPVDKENPRRCTACGKIFQNHFGVKTHYQNVHLKLMHKCTVEGCNAAFPSKRSRDRHSANLNLHRKLLSTSSDRSSGGYFDKNGAIYPFHPDAYRGDLFTRLYDHNSLPLSFAEIYHSRISAEGTGSPFLSGSPFAHLPGAIPGFHPAFLPAAATTMTNYKSGRYHHEQNSGRNSSMSSISNSSSPGSPRENDVQSPSVKLEEELEPDSEGRYFCTICGKKFHEGIVLREHYEKSHTQSLLHCSTNGCNKVFLSKLSRNNHSDHLHKEKSSESI